MQASTKKLAGAAVAALASISTYTIWSVNRTLISPIQLQRVIDGDTIEIAAPWLPSGLGDTIKVRLSGIDTPEKWPNSLCQTEADLALKAKAYVETRFKLAKDIWVVYDGWDKYGRPLGTVFLDRQNLNEHLVSSGYAVRYNGVGKKKDWCSGLTPSSEAR